MTQPFAMTANPEALPGWFRRRPDADEQSDPDTSRSDNAHDETAAGNLTTTGGSDDQKPVMVWEAANRMEAEIVAGRLHSEGIPAIIRGESLGAIYGLTTGSLAAATVWVPAALAAKAIEILATEVEWEEAEQVDPQESDDLKDLDSSDLDSGNSKRPHNG
jgi:hypothetical protein